jgi:hypothetical protein
MMMMIWHNIYSTFVMLSDGVRVHSAFRLLQWVFSVFLVLLTVLMSQVREWIFTLVKFYVLAFHNYLTHLIMCSFTSSSSVFTCAIDVKKKKQTLNELFSCFQSSVISSSKNLWLFFVVFYINRNFLVLSMGISNSVLWAQGKREIHRRLYK